MPRRLLAMLITVAALGGAAGAQELDRPAPKKTKSWFRWPSFKKPKEEPPAVLPVSPAVMRKQAEAARRRREAVYQRLMEIAAASNDPELERKALELNDLAWKNFLQVNSMPQQAFSDQRFIEGHLGLNCTPNGQPTRLAVPYSPGATQAARGGVLP